MKSVGREIRFYAAFLRQLRSTGECMRVEADVLKERQRIALRQHLRHAAETCSFWRLKLADAGIDPDEAEVVDLARLEPLRIEDITEELYPGLNRFGLTLEQAYDIMKGRDRPGRMGPNDLTAMHTSGTTRLGENWQQVPFLTSRAQLVRDRQHALAMGLKAVKEASGLWRFPLHMVSFTSQDDTRSSTTMARVMNQAPGLRVTRLPIGGEPEWIVDQLQRLDSAPVAITGGPSVLRVVIDAQARGCLGWTRPVVLLSGGWSIDDETVSRASRVGWTVFNVYGSTETGTIGVGLGTDTRVLSSEVVVEPVDRQGEPVPSGEWADRAFVTKLSAGIMPLIRYEVRDQIKLVDVGEPLRRIVVGERTEQHWIWRSGATAGVGSIWEVCSGHGVDRLLATKLANGARLSVVVPPGQPFQVGALRDELAGLLSIAGLDAPAVHIDLCEELPRGDKPTTHRWLDPEGLSDQ